MSNSKLSTKSASKRILSQISGHKREFVISGEFITGKSDISLDLDSSLNDKESFTMREAGNKEMNLMAELEALNASLIPDDSKSISGIHNSHIEEFKVEGHAEDLGLKQKPLILENSQIRNKWWCNNCILAEDKQKNDCCVI